MKEAIEDGYILNPIRGIVPVSAKMYFENPENELEGFENDKGYYNIPDNTDTGFGADGKIYAIRKKKIYANTERIEAISHFIVERLVTTVYHNIRGTAKAMLATTSIPNAIKYAGFIKKHFKEITKQKKYERFIDAPVFIVYSDSQDHQSSNSINDGVSEKTVLQNFKLAKNGLIIVVDKLQTGYDEPKLHTLFLDKEIRGINAIQTISRVNRTTKYKNDCKIVDFSYKNVNVKNIKVAFEHFSNVVVSDFDPLGDEGKLEIYYKDLKEHPLLVSQYPNFVKYHQGTKDINLILEMQNTFSDYIRKNKVDAKKLKGTINNYFKILNLIEFVIELDAKYSDALFLDYLRKYNNEYNNIYKPTDIIDDVEIYFDNKIGIVAPLEPADKDKPKSSVKGGATGTDDNKFKYNILKVIEKRNKEEEAIAEMIKDFEGNIDAFFNYIPTIDDGKRLIAKITDNGNAFSQDDIYSDFSKIYRRYTIINKDLGEFFKRETKDSLNQLCDDFEKTLKNN
jgi:type I restriction enzyme R subunit